MGQFSILKLKDKWLFLLEKCGDKFFKYDYFKRVYVLKENSMKLFEVDQQVVSSQSHVTDN